MATLLLNIKKILSDKYVTAIILLVAIASRITQLVFFFNIRVDRSYQLLATQNFVHGDGITTAGVVPADLSAIIYTPLVKWPPGYSFLMSPFYSISGNDYLLSAFVLDILFAIILVFVGRAILKLLDIPLYLVNIYTLITGFFIYYFYFITSSDAIATTFFIIALYYTLLFVKKGGSWFKAAMLITLFLFFCASIKYLFMPVIFVPPLFLVLKGFMDKDKTVLKTGILSALVLTSAITILLLYQKSISGSAAYVSEAARGFFPDNLLKAYPVVPGALIKPDTVTMLLNKPAIEPFVFSVFQWIYLLSIIVALFFSGWLFYKYRMKKISLPADFLVLMGAVWAVTTLVLAVLSVRVAIAEDMPGNWWTFIQEPRYYGLPNVLIHLSLFVIYHYYHTKIKRVFKYLLWFFIFLVAAEMFRGIIFTAKRITHFTKEEYSWQSDLRIQQYADGIIRREQQQKPGIKNVVVTGSSYYINNRISLYSHIPILQQPVRSDSLISLRTKEPVLLLVILNETDSPGLNSYSQLKYFKAAGQLHGFSFYTAEILPVPTSHPF